MRDRGLFIRPSADRLNSPYRTIQITIYYHYRSIEPQLCSQLIIMRINQEDRPGVSDLPPLEVERKVEKLAKQTLEEVITAIPPIENSTYIPIQIDPRNPSVNLPTGMNGQSPIDLFFQFVPQWLLDTITSETNAKARRIYEGEPNPHTR